MWFSFLHCVAMWPNFNLICLMQLFNVPIGDWYNFPPDERALVKGACLFGYIFETRTPHHVEINALGVRERYEILNVLEFTSTRKRMSIIARNPAGEIKLYCKGADTVIYERYWKHTVCHYVCQECSEI